MRLYFWTVDSQQDIPKTRTTDIVNCSVPHKSKRDHTIEKYQHSYVQRRINIRTHTHTTRTDDCSPGHHPCATDVHAGDEVGFIRIVRTIVRVAVLVDREREDRAVSIEACPVA